MTVTVAPGRRRPGLGLGLSAVSPSPGVTAGPDFVGGNRLPVKNLRDSDRHGGGPPAAAAAPWHSGSGWPGCGAESPTPNPGPRRAHDNESESRRLLP